MSQNTNPLIGEPLFVNPLYFIKYEEDLYIEIYIDNTTYDNITFIKVIKSCKLGIIKSLLFRGICSKFTILSYNDTIDALKFTNSIYFSLDGTLFKINAFNLKFTFVHTYDFADHSENNVSFKNIHFINNKRGQFIIADCDDTGSIMFDLKNNVVKFSPIGNHQFINALSDEDYTNWLISHIDCELDTEKDEEEGILYIREEQCPNNHVGYDNDLRYNHDIPSRYHNNEAIYDYYGYDNNKKDQSVMDDYNNDDKAYYSDDDEEAYYSDYDDDYMI